MNIAKQADDSFVLFIGIDEWLAIKVGLYLVTGRLDQLHDDYAFLIPIAAAAHAEMQAYGRVVDDEVSP